MTEIPDKRAKELKALEERVRKAEAAYHQATAERADAFIAAIEEDGATVGAIAKLLDRNYTGTKALVHKRLAARAKAGE